ncbi:hypothetical protein HMI56_005422 [Coelomomyces lativittatus]|nr:hypothetical protein HMI56_005422 [Coelomomyces lativittatus]
MNLNNSMEYQLHPKVLLKFDPYFSFFGGYFGLANVKTDPNNPQFISPSKIEEIKNYSTIVARFNFEKMDHYRLVGTIAHEISHLFGVSHDEVGGCGSQMFMTVSTAHLDPWKKFSKCSLSELSCINSFHYTELQVQSKLFSW